MTPDEIYAESFRIIEAEVGAHPYSAEEWPVVRRIVHACGDLDLARLVEFRNDAVREGVRALRAGAAIVTDVHMVAKGLNDKALKKLGIAVHCYVDQPVVIQLARKWGVTRSWLGMVRASLVVKDAVYVVGNAPTALMTLVGGVLAHRVRPRLVVAMPVGFVGAVESKGEACHLDVPSIIVPGRKGGSGMAAAAVNALLEMALAEENP